MGLGEILGNTVTKIKERFGGEYVDDAYYESDYEVENEESDYEEIAKPKNGFANAQSNGFKKMENPYASRQSSFTFVQKSTDKREKGASEERIVVYTPQTAADASMVADSIKDGNIVIVNILDSPISLEDSQRMCDYLVGVCYAVDARVETVTDDVLMMTPKGCRISFAEKNNIRKSAMGFANASGFGR